MWYVNIFCYCNTKNKLTKYDINDNLIETGGNNYERFRKSNG